MRETALVFREETREWGQRDGRRVRKDGCTSYGLVLFLGGVGCLGGGAIVFKVHRVYMSVIYS